jgi:hypothetical protein
MSRLWGDGRRWWILSAGAVVFVAAQVGQSSVITAEVTATPTPYHEGVPGLTASPHAMEPPLYPLPAPEDRASADAMAAGAAAMIEMAGALEAAADRLLSANDAKLVELGQHWMLDAQALQQQAAWMVLSATAADMIHDPRTAHEINAWNLRGNGMVMTAEGQAMAEHARSMTTQVEQLRADGALPPDVADALIAAGEELITTGEELARDGQRMQDTADEMLRLIGR